MGQAAETKKGLQPAGAALGHGDAGIRAYCRTTRRKAEWTCIAMPAIQVGRQASIRNFFAKWFGLRSMSGHGGSTYREENDER